MMCNYAILATDETWSSPRTSWVPTSSMNKVHNNMAEPLQGNAVKSGTSLGEHVIVAVPTLLSRLIYGLKRLPRDCY